MQWLLLVLVAQTPQHREGVWWAFGLGYGTYRHTCDRCERPTGRTETTAAWLGAGVAASRRVSVGLELASGYLRAGTHVTSTSLIALVYPAVAKGFFVRAGAGTSSYRQRLWADYPPFRGSGWGWQLGVGWDMRVDRRLSFTPMLVYRAGAPGTVAVGVDTAATNLRQSSLALTVGLTFH